MIGRGCGSLPPTRKTYIEILAPGFPLTQAQLMWAYENEPEDESSLSLSNKRKKKIFPKLSSIIGLYIE